MQMAGLSNLSIEGHTSEPRRGEPVVTHCKGPNTILKKDNRVIKRASNCIKHQKQRIQQLKATNKAKLTRLIALQPDLLHT